MPSSRSAIPISPSAPGCLEARRHPAGLGKVRLAKNAGCLPGSVFPPLLSSLQGWIGLRLRPQAGSFRWTRWAAGPPRLWLHPAGILLASLLPSLTAAAQAQPLPLPSGRSEQLLPPSMPSAPPPLGASSLLGVEPLSIGGNSAQPAPLGLPIAPAALEGPGGASSGAAVAPSLPPFPTAVSGAATKAAAPNSPASPSFSTPALSPPSPPVAGTIPAEAFSPGATITAPPPAIPAAPPAIPSAPPGTAPSPAPAGAVLPVDRALVLDRKRRQLSLLENGRVVRRFPVAVGMPGWETPVGRFQVVNKTENPVWEHPQKGTHTAPGPANPLGSRWIGFHQDCQGKRGWDGEHMLDVKGCVVAGFHGTPHRWTVGQALSHGCVRLYDEDVRQVFDFVAVGTPVTVLP